MKGKVLSIFVTVLMLISSITVTALTCQEEMTDIEQQIDSLNEQILKLENENQVNLDNAASLIADYETQIEQIENQINSPSGECSFGIVLSNSIWETIPARPYEFNFNVDDLAYPVMLELDAKGISTNNLVKNNIYINDVQKYKLKEGHNSIDISDQLCLGENRIIFESTTASGAATINTYEIKDMVVDDASGNKNFEDYNNRLFFARTPISCERPQSSQCGEDVDIDSLIAQRDELFALIANVTAEADSVSSQLNGQIDLTNAELVLLQEQLDVLESDCINITEEIVISEFYSDQPQYSVGKQVALAASVLDADGNVLSGPEVSVVVQVGLETKSLVFDPADQLYKVQYLADAEGTFYVRLTATANGHMAESTTSYTVSSGYTCSETDAGRDIYMKGSTSIFVGNILVTNSTDECESSSTLKEYYCESNASIASQELDCAFGCNAGACSPVTAVPIIESIWTDSWSYHEGDSVKLMVSSVSALETGADILVRGTLSYADGGLVQEFVMEEDGFATWAVTFESLQAEDYIAQVELIVDGAVTSTKLRDFTVAPAMYTCQDTDGNFNIFTWGEVTAGTTGNMQVYPDFCIDAENISEQACVGGKLFITNVSCEAGCVEGACNEVDYSNYLDSAWSDKRYYSVDDPIEMFAVTEPFYSDNFEVTGVVRANHTGDVVSEFVMEYNLNTELWHATLNSLPVDAYSVKVSLYIDGVFKNVRTFNIDVTDTGNQVEPTNITNSTLSDCATGCDLDNVCIPYGMRILAADTSEPSYCFFDGQMLPQKQLDQVCQNNFECASNTCSDGICVSLEERISALEELVKWLTEIINSIL